MVDSESGSTRRQFLRAVPVAVAAGVAGCQGSSGGVETTAPPTARPTPEPTQTETPDDTPEETAEEPPDLPNIERRVVERDRAAVTFISQVVSGTAVTTAFEIESAMDADLLGEWAVRSATLTLYPDRTFTATTDESTVSGGWAANDGTLVLQYESGERSTYSYEVSGGTQTTLELSQDGQSLPTYTKQESFEDDRGPVLRARDLLVEEDPDATEPATDSIESQSRGSGFIVSPDGYVVTNSHVAVENAPRERLRVQFSQDLIRVIRQAIEEEEAELTRRERDQMESYLFEEFWEYITAETEIQDIETNLNVLYGRATPSEDLQVASWSADLVDAGQFTTVVDGQRTIGRDVAILKVDETGLPTVPLGSAGGLSTGEDIFVVGYPALRTGDVFRDRNTTLEPTVTTGIVSARRTLLSGVETIQTDAALNGGNSGGPMYNSDGEVVGIATFKQNDPRVDDVNFGLPIGIAKDFMDRYDIENTTSEVHEIYKDGLDAYWRGDCETVRDRMNAVLDRQPNHPYAGDYIEDCNSGDAPGQS